MKTEYLFVYGTLRSDSGSVWHDRLIAPYFTLAGTGNVQGMLYSLGEYPGLVETVDENSRVAGEVWAFDPDRVSLQALDQYEGCDMTTPQPHEYKRIMAPVVMQDGTRLEAWCYYYVADVSSFRPIRDWLER